MATRRDILQRKAHLRRSLMQSIRDGALGPGEMLPPLRELALEYGVSAPTASQVIRELVQEGVLYTRSTAGTYVGRTQSTENSLFLFVSPTGNLQSYIVSLRNGFEERIAQLGGSSLSMERATAHQWKTEGRLPAFAGIFDFGIDQGQDDRLGESVFRVEFGKAFPNVANTDTVFFDNVDGGRQATSHLIRLGHQKIAFLGLHTPFGDNGEFVWSEERENGWRQAMEQEGRSVQALAFHPQVTPSPTYDHDVQRSAARDASRLMLSRGDITAVVAVNAHTTYGLIEVLRALGIPENRWPAVVSFDGSKHIDGHIISSLHQPWQNLGSEAADMLWQRCRGELTGPAQQRLVPMRLVPRLSCRREWPMMPAMVGTTTLVSTA